MVVLVLFADLLGCTLSEVLAWCGMAPGLVTRLLMLW
jgi:hypothetical protein